MTTQTDFQQQNLTQPITIDTITRDQRSILMYAETCAVDHGGLLEGIRMNSDDIAALDQLEAAGIVKYGRVPGKMLGSFRVRQATHWCDLTEAGWALAYALRRARAAKPDANRKKVDAVFAERAEAANG